MSVCREPRVRGCRSVHRWAACWVIGALFSFSAFDARAAEVVKVEEDWELTILSPETVSNSPQVTCAMSALGSDDGIYMSFELNHQSQPDYQLGGLHLHAWDGEYLCTSAHAQSRVTFQTANEQVSWTQSMSLVDGQLVYEITNGVSETWGSFGTGELRASTATTLSNLNGYRMEHSVESSGVGFGANRVAAFVLRRVRYTTDAGEVIELPVDQSVLETE